MHLYSLTLQKPTAITQAVQGAFSGPKVHEIVVSRGRVLELLRVDENAKLRSVWSTDVFGIIRSIAAFRLTGSSKDYLVVGSDSGRIVVLEYVAARTCFEKVHQETFGKSGVRRIVPGQFLAADPKGRALMIGAVERSKFVYVLNRDSSNKLTISSPLEAHKSHQICFGITGVDVGFENPIFASIEQNYEAADKVPKSGKVAEYTPPPKGLSFWEMDLGLNHVIKKCTLPCDDSAHLLIPVPGGSGVHVGPSGTIVCCENFIVYKKPDHPDVACAIPRRLEMGQDAKMLVVSFAMHRLKEFFFFLIQTEFGDLYKIELNHERQDDRRVVTEVICRYLDSVPIANGMCVLKSGYLFLASEFGNHYLYQFTGIGNDETDPACTSLHPHGKDCIVAFKPRALKNLTLVDELPSLSPITDMKILDALNVGQPQIYVACGKGPRSSLRILQYGVGVEELADNELPGKPVGVWTLRENIDAAHDSLMVVSFSDSTLLLSIGETVEEVTGSSFDHTVETLHVALMYDNSNIQVHQGGIRHLQQKRVNEWRAPPGRRVTVAASSARQICIALSGGELLSFEIDDSHSLTETCRRELGYEVNYLSLQPIPTGRTRSMFVAVSGLDNTVRLLSLDVDKELRQLALQSLPSNAHAESCCLLYLDFKDPSGVVTSSLYLFIGLETGILLRATVDMVTGALSDQRTRFLGPKGVKLHRVGLGIREGGSVCSSALIALSTKPWLCFSSQRRLNVMPMHYDSLEYVSSFSSEQCPDGFVAIYGRSLRIFQCSGLGETFTQTVVPLSYTPRKFCVLPPPAPQIDVMMSALTGPVTNPIPPSHAVIAVVEADHNAYDEATKTEIAEALARIKLDGGNDEESDDMEIKEEAKDEKEKPPPEEQVGTYRAGAGKWGSCIRVIHPASRSTISKKSLDVDEAALCCTVCRFWEFDSPCLIVGTVYGLIPRKRQCTSASIKVFAYNSEYKITLLHSTLLEDQPTALCPWDGRLLVAMGKRVRIYSLGRKKLLKKCEYRTMPECVTWLRVVGDRIYAGDAREGFHVLKYKASENALHVVVDETRPFWLTCGEVLDYHTVVGGDKFDSVLVSRANDDGSKAEETGDMSGLRLKGDMAYLVGECAKFEHVASYHIGETLTAIQKATLTPGGSEALIYSTVMGSIGALLPLLTNDEVDLLLHLEMAMRNAAPPLCGREHISYRSYYAPARNVIDGDLCEQFKSLPVAKQKEMAEELDRTIIEISRKLEELRNRIL